jgi:hypothetical protein
MDHSNPLIIAQQTHPNFDILNHYSSKLMVYVISLLFQIPLDHNTCTKVYTPKNKLIAKGYRRIVFSDHGPYVEFETLDHTNLYKARQGDWFDTYLEKGTPKAQLNVYYQTKPVRSRNPPRNGLFRADNDRAGGYADYARGYYYISIFHLKFRFNNRDTISGKALEAPALAIWSQFPKYDAPRMPFQFKPAVQAVPPHMPIHQNAQPGRPTINSPITTSNNHTAFNHLQSQPISPYPIPHHPTSPHFTPHHHTTPFQPTINKHQTTIPTQPNNTPHTTSPHPTSHNNNSTQYTNNNQQLTSHRRLTYNPPTNNTQRGYQPHENDSPRSTKRTKISAPMKRFNGSVRVLINISPAKYQAALQLSVNIRKEQTRRKSSKDRYNFRKNPKPNKKYTQTPKNEPSASPKEDA